MAYYFYPMQAMPVLTDSIGRKARYIFLLVTLG